MDDDEHMVGDGVEDESSHEAGNVDFDDEELIFDDYGYIVINGVADKSYREPGSLSEHILDDGTRTSEGEGVLEGERDVLEFYIMRKEM